jgi:hypothetical protein
MSRWAGAPDNKRYCATCNDLYCLVGKTNGAPKGKEVIGCRLTRVAIYKKEKEDEK